MEFVCVRKCLFGGQLFNKNDVLEFGGDVEKCNCKDGCRVCGYSKRVMPPHHFVPKARAEKEKALIRDRKVNKLAKLREEFKAMEKPYDKRWGSERLECELLKAKKSGVKLEKAEEVKEEKKG